MDYIAVGLICFLLGQFGILFYIIQKRLLAEDNKMFIVVDIHQCYEDIENIKCVGKFDTEQEAIDFVQETKNSQTDAWELRDDYINKFVENIPVVEKVNHLEWMDYLEQFGMQQSSIHTTPGNFKQRLGYKLKGDPSIKLKDYDPPPHCEFSNLFVVKV